MTHAGNVEQGSIYGRHRNPVDRNERAQKESIDVVDPEVKAPRTTGARCRNFSGGRLETVKAPTARRRAMRSRAALSRPQHAGHQVAFPGRRGAGDSVDPG